MKYLTKTMREALDYFNSHEPNLQERFFNVMILPFDYGTIEQLVLEGFAVYADRQHTAIRILDKGKHYREIIKRDKYEYWKDKLIVFGLGFLSGVLTSVLASFILSILRA